MDCIGVASAHGPGSGVDDHGVVSVATAGDQRQVERASGYVAGVQKVKPVRDVHGERVDGWSVQVSEVLGEAGTVGFGHAEHGREIASGGVG